jgi:hypothetical protein
MAKSILELYEANKTVSFTKGGPDIKALEAFKKDITPYTKGARDKQAADDDEGVKAFETKKGIGRYQLGDLGAGSTYVGGATSAKKYSATVKKDPS